MSALCLSPEITGHRAVIESPARGSSITPRISYLAVAGSQGLSPSCLRFSSCHVSFHSLPDDFCHSPAICGGFAVLPETGLR